MAGTRMDIAKLGGPWSDTMIWYARAVGALRERPFNDRTSWVYLGSLHGIDVQGWIDQGLLPSTIPSLPVDPLPDRFRQCQHAGWFFLPWHRGYVFSMEAILADWISSQAGPSNWALPYWNYLDDSNPNARNIPQEFLDSTMPDGSPNPLSNALRGPAIKLGPQTWVASDISLTAQTSEADYTAIPGTLGYGGPISGFAQFGNAGGGNESDPHNLVHVMIGGDTTPEPQGWMFDPNFAALDPIFWVHHCNVDRLWEAWMTDPSHIQEIGPAWKNGPFPMQFTMPDPSGSLWIFVPEDTLPGAELAPTYESLQDGTGIASTAPSGALAMTSPPAGSSPESRAGLVGANQSTITITRSQVKTSIKMMAQPAADISAAVGVPSVRYYLNLEGVKGKSASAVLNVVLTIPGEAPLTVRPEATKSIVLFGLSNATEPEGPHGGNGLSATVEITDVVNVLQASSPEDIEAHINLPETAGDHSITIERISIYAKQRA